MVDALLLELDQRSDYLGTKDIATVYFGGGSPSILGQDLLQKILDHVRAKFSVDPNAEITLEANPDDMTPSSLEGWSKLGVNRLSVGIQSFIDDRLTAMNRAHNSHESLQCISLAQAAGFDNLSIDLIYGLPGMSEQEWDGQLARALELNIQHISAYCLTIEPETVFGKMHERGELKALDEDAAASQFLAMREATSKAGFDHYEVSNFGLSDFHSKHNSAYWSGEHYLGIGPSAHSFNGKSRQWSVSNNGRYMKSLEAGELDFEMESMSSSDLFNERVMTGLRTSIGLDASRLMELTGFDIEILSQNQIRDFVDQGLMLVESNRIKLTPSGLLQADGIASEMFIID
jgi:putative oxygen-independent coproporphyrinogen III oxidase